MSVGHAARPRGALWLVGEESSSSRWCHSCARLWPRVTGRLNRQGKPSDPGWPRPGLHGVRSGRGSSRGAETSWRRRTDTTGSPRCPGWIRRLMLVIATSARTGAIMSVAAASARGSTAGRRSGAGAGDQVTVTDSHHPALRMAPAASSRRQCPRDSWTCCPRPWLPRGREWPEGSRIGPLCAGHLAVATRARLGFRSRPDLLMESARFEWWAAFLPPTRRHVPYHLASVMPVLYVSHF